MIGRDASLAASAAPRPISLGSHDCEGAGRIRGFFKPLRATLDAGDSLWTPVLVYLIGWLLVLPAFLVMIGLSFGAYYLAGGE